MRTVDLIKSPEQILRCSIDVVTARVVWEVVAERRFGELRAEEVDFVQEQDDRCPHEPPRVHDGVEEN